MVDSQKYDIIYMLLEGETEKTYNLHRYELDRTKTLHLVMKSLKTPYAYRDHDPANEMQKRSERPQVETKSGPVSVLQLHTYI